MFSIYKITNTINDKIYIGKTAQEPSNRFNEHIYASTNQQSQYLIHRAIRKYGAAVMTFDVIFNSFYEKDLAEFEIFFIKEHSSCILDSISHGYNMTRGGEGFTTETARKYAGWNNPTYINPWSGEKGSQLSTKLNNERVKNGTNPWAGTRGSLQSKAVSKHQLEQGTHPFQGEHGSKMASERNKKLIEEGRHINQLILSCPHCNKTGVGRTMFRWHFKNCKFKINLPV